MEARNRQGISIHVLKPIPGAGEGKGGGRKSHGWGATTTRSITKRGVSGSLRGRRSETNPSNTSSP